MMLSLRTRITAGLFLPAFFGAAVFFAYGGVSFSHAQTDIATSTLQAQIDASAARISTLNKEIAELQVQLDATTKQKQTLQTAVQALNLNIQKLTKSISLTQAQIAKKDSEIRTLSGDITDTTGRINGSQDAIGKSLRELNTLDDESLAEVLIGGGTLSSFFDQMTTLAAMRGNLEAHIEDLSVQKSTLLTSKSAAERKRSELASLKQDLA